MKNASETPKHLRLHTAVKAGATALPTVTRDAAGRPITTAPGASTCACGGHGAAQ